MAKANVVNTNVVPVETKVFPYYDDFNEDKSFHRILFRPGYAVQARELTQLQTILQNQIERFGQHIFVNGSSVIGGEVKYTPIVALNLTPTYANTTVVPSNFINKTIKHESGNNDVIARVIQTSNATETDPPTLFLKYVSGNEFEPGATIKVDGEEIYANLVSTSNVKANGVLAFIEDSVYFYDGYFMKVPKQTVVASKYTPSANCKIGLELDDSIITEVADSSLLDPALESSNYQAPGASRYKADLILARRNLDSIDDEKFIEIARLEEGVLRKNVTIPVYSEIEEVFARRTFDESGNYTVKPFRIFVEDSVADSANNVAAILSEGKGYILGFEFETIAPTTVEVPRARTKANATNYNLNCNFGNYVVVDKLNGAFDTIGMGVVDVHCVPSENVVFTTARTYDSSKIGTARVRDIEFFSGDTDVTQRKHELYFFDTRFNSLSNTASGTANALNQIVLNPASSTSENNAYQGATIRITAGSSSGDERRIVSYNGASKIAFVDRNFTGLTTATSQYTITFDFSSAESFVANTTYTVGSPTNSNANITILNKDNGLANGKTFVFESSLSPLVFPLPEKYIVEGSLRDPVWNYRRVYTNVQFTNGVSDAIIAGTDEGFEGTSASSNVASTILDNFLIISSTGQQVKATTTVSGSPEQVVFDTGNAGDNFTATIYAKMDVADTAAVPRVKSLVLANTATFATESPANTFISSTGSNTSIYLNSGQVVIQNPSKVYDVRESLYISDVVAVKKIYDLRGAAIPAAGDQISAFDDVTSRFIFDNGQKESYYDHASIRLRPGAIPCNGPLIVCCRYYKTTTDRGYFSVDSYPSLNTEIIEENINLGTGYANIPAFGQNNLRDCIDFRPLRVNATNNDINYILSGVRIPIPATDFQTDYEYYLGRRDLIVLTGNRTFERISGVPSKYPQYPTVPTRSMVLHTLNIPPYTSYPANVEVGFVENKRYTMRDIGNIDNRLRNVEYYVSLSNLQKRALDIQIRDVDGLERTKYGIFTDSFIGHSLGDSILPDYRVSVDLDGRASGDGVATNEFYVQGNYLDPEYPSRTNIAVGQDRLTLQYTVEPAITQNTATKFTPVADLLFASFEGNTITVPEADIWRDVTRNVVINRINVVNNVNLRRFITPWQSLAEAQQIQNGMRPIDVLNGWARGNNIWGESNLAFNERGSRSTWNWVTGQNDSLRAGEGLFDLAQLNNLNRILGI